MAKSYVLQCSECGEDLVTMELAEENRSEEELVQLIKQENKLVICQNCGSREFKLAD